MKIMNPVKQLIIGALAICFLFTIAYAAIYQIDDETISSGDLKQLVGEVSTVQRYRIGTKLKIGERVFRYAKLGTNAGIGKDTYYGYGLAPADTLFLCCHDRTPKLVGGQMGQALCTLRIAGIDTNDLQGGLAVFIDSSDSEKMWSTEILANTKATSTNDTVFVTLMDTLPFTLAATFDTCMVYPNTYSKLVVPNGSRGITNESIVGFCTWFNAAGTDLEGYYVWVQTWGPYAPKIYTLITGGDPFQRTYYHLGGGYVATPDSLYGFIGQSEDSTAVISGGMQKVGYSIARTTTAIDFPRPLMFITLNP